ncbi:hypothetical protein D3C75_1254340 [compost metagenome]
MAEFAGCESGVALESPGKGFLGLILKGQRHLQHTVVTVPQLISRFGQTAFADILVHREPRDSQEQPLKMKR